VTAVEVEAALDMIAAFINVVVDVVDVLLLTSDGPFF
jgi:hypothetical protein